MKNLTKIFALTALAALIALSMTAMSLTGCRAKDGGGAVDAGGGSNTTTENGNSDPLNGTWACQQDTSFSVVLKLDNGAFEMGSRNGGAYHPSFKGTYTTSGSEITMTITHVPGYLVSEWYDIDDTEEWYSIDEILQLDPKKAGNWADDVVVKGTYSLDGNELTLTSDGMTETYTRE